jgi:DUF4097 and DUF4098 domain-containing protein YvlB
MNGSKPGVCPGILGEAFPSGQSFRVALAAVVWLIASLGPATAALSSNLHQVFSASPEGRFALQADQGNIEIRAGPDDRLEIEVVRRVTRASDQKARQVLAAHEVSFRQDGPLVSVKAKLHRDQFKRNWLGSGPDLQVSFVISVPTRYSLELGTQAGSIKVGVCQGPVVATTSAGSIRLEECARNATLQTSAGTIHVDKAVGALKARTSAGGIEVGSAGASIQAVTGAGSIKVNFAGSPEADCELKTGAGEVRVGLPETANLRVDVQPQSGTAQSDLPLKLEASRKGHRLIGTLGAGGSLLRIRTGAGSVHLERLASPTEATRP